MEESLYRYSSPTVVEVRDLDPVKSFTERRELKIRFLYKALPISFSDIEKIYFKGFRKSTRWGLRLDCFPVLMSYHSDIPEVKDVSGLQHGTSIRRPCFWCLSVMINLQTIRCGGARSIHDTLKLQITFFLTGSSWQFLSWWENPYSYISWNNEGKWCFQRYFDIPKLVFLRESHLALEFVLGIFYDIFWFERRHNLHLCVYSLRKNVFSSFMIQIKW